MCFVYFIMAITRLYRIVTYCFLHQGELIWSGKKRLRIQWRCRDGQSCWWETKEMFEGTDISVHIGAYRCMSTKLHGFTFHIDQQHERSLSFYCLYYFCFSSVFISSLSLALSFLRLTFPSFCPNICHPLYAFIFISFFIVFSVSPLLLPVLFYILCVLPQRHLFMSSCFGFVFSFSFSFFLESLYFYRRREKKYKVGCDDAWWCKELLYNIR
jgi:hypothetical protein